VTQHGITSNTVERFLLDEGAVYLDYGEGTEQLLGATRGGNRFEIEQDIREMPVAGAKGPVKGGRRVIRAVARIVANMVELTTDSLIQALPGADSSSITSYDSIERDREIALTDYLVNVAILGTVSGSANPAIFLITLPIGAGNLTLGLTWGDEAVQELTFEASYDPAALDTEPWEIRWPDDV